MFWKPFSFYDDLELTYSKDKAMGSKAKIPADRNDEETMLEDTTSSKGEEVPSEVSATNKRVVDEGSSKDKAKKNERKNKEIRSVQKNLEIKLEKMIEGNNYKLRSWFQCWKPQRIVNPICVKN